MYTVLGSRPGLPVRDPHSGAISDRSSSLAAYKLPPSFLPCILYCNNPGVSRVVPGHFVYDAHVLFLCLLIFLMLNHYETNAFGLSRVVPVYFPYEANVFFVIISKYA